MSVITKFIISVFFEFFLSIYLGIFGILLVVQIFDKLDEFIKTRAQLPDILIYFISLSPSLLIDIFPLVFIFTCIVFILFISRSNELIALRTLGIRHQSIISVFILLAFSLSIICIFIDFNLVPIANRKVSEIWYDKLNKKEKKGVLQGDLLFYKGDNRIWVAEDISADAKEIKDLIIFHTDSSYKSKDIFFINKLSYIKENDWNASGLFEIKILFQNSELDGNFSLLSKHNEKLLALKEKPSDFVALRNPVSELGFNALFSTILKSRKGDLINNEAETLVVNKIFFPFLSVSLCFALLPMVLPTKKDEIVIEIAKAIIIATSVWAVWKFSINLGKSGKISPLIPFLFLHIAIVFLGMYNLKKIKF